MLLVGQPVKKTLFGMYIGSRNFVCKPWMENRPGLHVDSCSIVCGWSDSFILSFPSPYSSSRRLSLWKVNIDGSLKLQFHRSNATTSHGYYSRVCHLFQLALPEHSYNSSTIAATSLVTAK